MARTHRLPFLHSTLIVGRILAPHSLAIAFLPRHPRHNYFPAQSRTENKVSFAAMSSAANALTPNDEETGESTADTVGGKPSAMVYRYNSPFFPVGNGGSRQSSALIILNTPIKSRLETKPNGKLSGVLGALWETSSYRVCADGGANRLYDATVAIDDDSTTFLPDLITGDLDSLRPDVRKHYEARGVSIKRVEDQNFHDLDKSLMGVETWIEQKNSVNGSCEKVNSNVFIYGGFGGRFDQEMGVINALCVWGKKESFRETTLAVYDEETCAVALPALPMKSEIRVRFPGDGVENEEQISPRVGEGPTCGLIPMLGRCENVTTTGLKWNLEGDMPLEFGGLVSSSNRAMSEVVTVETSTPMVFTAEMIVKQG